MAAPALRSLGIHINLDVHASSRPPTTYVTRGEELMDRFYWRDEDWATQIEWDLVLHTSLCPAVSSNAVPTTPEALRSWKARGGRSPRRPLSSTSTVP